MNKGLAFVERLPFASVSKIWLSTFEYLLLYLIILCIFYFLYKPAKQIIWVVLTGMLLLCISVSAKYVKQFNTNSLTFLNLRKHNGIVFKQGNEAVVLTDIAVNDKTFRYAIQPGLDSAGIKTAHIYSFGQDISLSYLKKTGSLINYNQRLLLIADTNLQFKYPVKPLNTDYLYITGNPYKVLKQINKNLNTGLLVISADNSNTFVDTLTKQLSATQKKYYVLKRNKSLNLVSN